MYDNYDSDKCTKSGEALLARTQIDRGKRPGGDCLWEFFAGKIVWVMSMRMTREFSGGEMSGECQRECPAKIHQKCHSGNTNI